MFVEKYCVHCLTFQELRPDIVQKLWAIECNEKPERHDVLIKKQLVQALSDIDQRHRNRLNYKKKRNKKNFRK